MDYEIKWKLKINGLVEILKGYQIAPLPSDLYEPEEFSEGLATCQIESGILNSSIDIRKFRNSKHK